MVLSFLTFIHVLCGLAGIGSGAIVLLGMLKGELFEKSATLFLSCSLVVSVTGFLFPCSHLLPTHGAAVFVIYVAAMAIPAWRMFYLVGIWNSIFVLSIIIILGLDTLVAVAHAFTFTPALRELAPTQTELPFLVTEFAIMLVFVVLGTFAVKRFHN